ncbi:MAG: hypothetical protein JWM61_521 [Micrococcaceae bacterium]|jgi:pimeloyl-ACP methyl ester carboxylesterase|nr:hypothetical protein [Micrococcaceae bacterium]
MEGRRSSVRGADGVDIGLLTCGSGWPLLLIHGGMGRLERWEPMWPLLTDRWRVTAMDRRGRGTSGDSEPYLGSKESADIANVAAALAHEHGGAIDVFAHSIGATFALGAATSAAFRRLALYEPPGPLTVAGGWVNRVSALVAEGQTGRAAFSFLTEIIGLSAEQVQSLLDSPRNMEVLPIVAATIEREARALAEVDLVSAAQKVTSPVMLLLGSRSPHWAHAITGSLADNLASAHVVTLPNQGHEAIDHAPGLVLHELEIFFNN